MTNLDSDTIRKALNTARSNGFAEVKIRAGGDTFSAVLSPQPSILEEADLHDELPELAAEPEVWAVRAPAVGYFREAKLPLLQGQEVSAGSSLGDVVALGIANDVSLPAKGVLKALLVKSGDAVEFGQILAEVQKS